MKTLFNDRQDAGKALAQRLARFMDEHDVLVLALARGGVPVAHEIARTLRIPLDIFEQGQSAQLVAGKTVIIVDEGIATGARVRAAIFALRQLNAKRVVVAMPVAPLRTVWELREEVDELITILAPARFFDVAEWYKDFAPVSDDQFYRLLEDAAEPAGII